MTDTLLWLAFGCWAASFAVAVLVVRARSRRRMEAYRALLAAEQAAYLARLESWVRER